jgi:transglutaminase-like putative cysteine protease
MPLRLSFRKPEAAMIAYLESTSVIDWQHPSILDLAHELAGNSREATAKNCFEWVRDEIKHSGDCQLNPITCSASHVLQAGTGFCYAKSHLLAALLRANSIPAALCYQRLSLGDGKFCLHGLNAIQLPHIGWYRVDARGNKPGVNAQFDPPHERLAFKIELPGEMDLPDVYPTPLPHVVHALTHFRTVDDLASNLPDVES